MTATRAFVKRAETELRRFALAYPEAHEDFPWGERVVKVRNKVFVFLHLPSDGLSVTVKLPASGALALGLPFASPTGYGLGKSGWVTARFGPGVRPPVDLLKQWIDESYRAVAPKALVARLASPAPDPTGGAASGPGSRRRPARRSSGRRSGA